MWQQRTDFLKKVYEQIGKVEGDVVECGVKKGRSFAYLASLVASEGKGRELWGFDSWEDGFVYAAQDSFHVDTGHRLVGTVSYEDATRILSEKLKRKGIFARDWVHLVQGYLADSLPIHAPEKVAFAHIDVDIYHSYLDALGNLWPRCSLGAVLVLDEYHEVEQWPGAKKAVDEFLSGQDVSAYTLIPDYRWYVVKQ